MHSTQDVNKALSIHNLTLAAHGKVLVDNLSLQVPQGSITAIIGESGSGKTLTALASVGLLPAAIEQQQGRIVLHGQDVTQYTPQQWQPLRGKQVGFVFQEPLSALNPLHRVNKQITEAAWLHGMRGHALQQALLHVAQMVELPERCLQSYPHQLSGGQRQRAMMAAAFINQPPLLIADEPTTALDAVIKQKVLQCLCDMVRQQNSSLLIITHDLRAIAPRANHVYVMHKGKVVEAGAQVLISPTHPYTKELHKAAYNAATPPIALANTASDACALQNVSVTYQKTTALHASSLTVKQGETLGVAGGSGSGKTTLALALLRLLPCKGQIYWQQQPVHDLQGKRLRLLRRHVQAVFQDPLSALSPRLSVQQIIAEGIEVHFTHLTAAQVEDKVINIMQQLHLNADDRHRYAHEFSGGQRQRIAIAAALVVEPQMIVFDEPTGALDPTVQAQLLDLLKDIQQKTGVSYVFISHDLAVLRTVAHRVLVVHEGRIVEEGSTTQVLQYPVHAYTKMLVEAV